MSGIPEATPIILTEAECAEFPPLINADQVFGTHRHRRHLYSESTLFCAVPIQLRSARVVYGRTTAHQATIATPSIRAKLKAVTPENTSDMLFSVKHFIIIIRPCAGGRGVVRFTDC
jgi:hypothetical protein